MIFCLKPKKTRFSQPEDIRREQRLVIIEEAAGHGNSGGFLGNGDERRLGDSGRKTQGKSENEEPEKAAFSAKRLRHAFPHREKGHPQPLNEHTETDNHK